jgi:hypothetical protein
MANSWRFYENRQIINGQSRYFNFKNPLKKLEDAVFSVNEIVESF